MESICKLCLKPEKEARFKLLVEVTNFEMSNWTYNILSLRDSGKLCVKCCQSVSFVGEMLFKWREKIRVSLHSAVANLETGSDGINPVPDIICKRLGLEKGCEPTEEEPESDLIEKRRTFEEEIDTEYVSQLESIGSPRKIVKDKKQEAGTNSVQQQQQQQSFACRVCSQELSSSARLRNHERVKHRIRSDEAYACITCSKQFSTKKLLREHGQTHRPPRTHKRNSGTVGTTVCSIPGCGRSFLKSSEKSHLRAVHGIPRPLEKSYLCRFCPQTYIKHDRLVDHERMHTNEKPFQCQHCPKSFRIRQFLQIHESVHTGEKKYKCLYCDRYFRVKNNRDTHQRHVHKTKQFPCPNGCGKIFIRKKHVVSHEQECAKRQTANGKIRIVSLH